MKSLLATVSFLTRFPIPLRWLDPQQDYARCVKYFPLVGILLGVVTACFCYGAMLVVPELPAAVLVTAFAIALSGGLHLDGLADTADGFLSGRPRAKALEIMKDSRIGTMGALALVTVFTLKIALLAELFEHSPSTYLSAIALALFSGRCALVWAMRLNRYVREEGFGHGFWHRSWFLSLLSLCAFGSLSWPLLGWYGLAGVAAAVGSVVILGWCSHFRIGGATGDIAGASCELSETCFLLGVIAAMQLGGAA